MSNTYANLRWRQCCTRVNQPRCSQGGANKAFSYCFLYQRLYCAAAELVCGAERLLWRLAPHRDGWLFSFPRVQLLQPIMNRDFHLRGRQEGRFREAAPFLLCDARPKLSIRFWDRRDFPNEKKRDRAKEINLDRVASSTVKLRISQRLYISFAMTANLLDTHRCIKRKRRVTSSL